MCANTQSKLNKVEHSRKNKLIRLCTKGVFMTSQPRHFFQANQAVHGADDITTLPF